MPSSFANRPTREGGSRKSKVTSRKSKNQDRTGKNDAGDHKSRGAMSRIRRKVDPSIHALQSRQVRVADENNSAQTHGLDADRRVEHLTSAKVHGDPRVIHDRETLK